MTRLAPVRVALGGDYDVVVIGVALGETSPYHAVFPLYRCPTGAPR